MPNYSPEEATDLPELTAIMVVDVEGFSRHNDPQQDELALLIHEVLEEACDRCGLEELWEQRKFPDSTGDGFIIGFAPRLLPRVVDRYFDNLPAALAAKASRLRPRHMPLRIRLSLNLGPARVLDNVDSPVGNAMITTHRLVDGGPLREMLKRSDPDVTMLAVALSERVMTDVVTAGHTRRRTPSQFVECPLEIAGKDFAATMYLHAPAVSGDLLRHGLLGAVPAKPIELPRAAPGKRRKPSAEGPAVGRVDGDRNVVAGGNIDQSSRSTTVHGNQNSTTVHGNQNRYEAGRDMTFRRGEQ